MDKIRFEEENGRNRAMYPTKLALGIQFLGAIFLFAGLITGLALLLYDYASSSAILWLR